MYGPTTGDKVRLGDTNLFAEIEKDYTVYGDESVFGGGKVIRDGMGQSSGNQPADSLDTVITNAVIIDYSEIFKADIGIKDGRIVGLGKSGNPDVMDGVSCNMIIGVTTIYYYSWFWKNSIQVTYACTFFLIRLTLRSLRGKDKL